MEGGQICSGGEGTCLWDRDGHRTLLEKLSKSGFLSSVHKQKTYVLSIMRPLIPGTVLEIVVSWLCNMNKLKWNTLVCYKVNFSSFSRLEYLD